MNQRDFTLRIKANVTAKEAFDSICNVTMWWTKNLVGASHRLNDEFTVQFDDIHKSTQRLVEVVTNQRLVWLVSDS
jgi:hypothetical protein